MKVLFLTRWYPTKYDPMFGLFVERHAQAVSEYCEVLVLYIHPDNKCQEKYIYEYENNEKLNVLRIYYRKPTSGLFNIFKFLNLILYLKYCFIGYKTLRKQFGKPNIIHVNILTRVGLLALLLKKFSGIPYIITEHWTRYMPVTSSYYGWLRKLLTKIVVKNASAVTTVSVDLKNAMLAHNLKNNNYIRVANVVDTALFHPATIRLDSDKTRIIHVSCFDDKQKNISGILNVINKLYKIRQDFELRLVGEGPSKSKLELYAEELGIKDKAVFFDGLLTGTDIVSAYQNSDFLLMFSNYETFCIVIIESYACGIPVISSNVPSIAEIVNKDNGLLVNIGDEEELLKGLIKMMDICSNFDKVKIRDFAVDNFSNSKVAQQFLRIYDQTLNL